MGVIEAPRVVAVTEEEAMEALTFIQMSIKFMPPFNESNHHSHHLGEVGEVLVLGVPKALTPSIDLKCFRYRYLFN